MKEQHSHTMESFGNYNLVRRIDAGGMGEVYLARQRTAFNREVAIKIIREDLADDATTRERFLREAHVSAHLKHEHILQFIEFGEEDGRLFFVTPYIEGGTLARHLQDGPLPLSEVHHLFPALVNAVAYIHRRGVVHRDLKPSNILLDQASDGQVYVRLIDFGIARIQGATASPPLTVAGNEMGTIAYMAPERMSGIAAPSNDIYSLGVILYQMLTGQLPASEQAVPRQQPLLADVVQRCMAHPINERFGSAEEVLAAFERTYQHITLSTRVLPSTSEATDQQPQETVSLQHSGATSPATGPFGGEDYDAPTTTIDSSQIPGKGHTQPQLVHADRTSHRVPGQRKRPLVPIVFGLSALVLVGMAALLVLQFLAFSSVSIQFSPQTHLVSKVFQLTASTTVTKVDAASASIPAKVLSKSGTASRMGSTTGQSCIIFIGCQQIVSFTDVDTLTAQTRSSLEPQINQGLQQQILALGASPVGTTQFTDVTPPTSVPPVGSPSRTVKVTLTEQGSVGYFVNSDARTLARQLQVQQMQAFGANYIPLDATIQIGQPVVGTVSNAGVIKLKIAAAGYVEYQFPHAQLLDIQNHLKGMTVKNANSFLAQQTGVDANTVSIRFTMGHGDTLPGDVQQIKITPTNPIAPPPAQLPRVTSNSTQ